MTLSYLARTRRKAVWGPKRTLGAALVVFCGLATNVVAAGHHDRQGPKATPGAPSARVKSYKLDDEVTRRSVGNPLSTSSVIVTLVPGAQLPPEFKKYARADKLDIINGQVLDLPNGMLKHLAAHPAIFRIHDNRPIGKFNYRTAVTVGATLSRMFYGYTGAGVGVAVIDSGIGTWHDDLTNKSSTSYPYGNQRVKKFVDFVNGQALPYDDNGHGSHVSGIIAGNGYDSAGQKAGIAPDASILSLKVLNADGRGTISSMIAALNWVAANAATYNIRVVNMSVGAPIRESYWTDPLTLAAKAVTEKGITVVTAAGNFGKNAAGQLQYGGITAPGNAPWVLTVGASSTMGTLTRTDDTMAGYSSSGPTFIDYSAKPDLVAPGTGTISLAVPGSTFYATKTTFLVNGTLPTGAVPYLSLSGTSMAAPVVTGTVALMLQANPALTPNLIKAILEYTAQVYHGYSPLRQGAGFLNTFGAVQLAKFYATAKPGDRMPSSGLWSKRIIWGNHMLTGGYLKPTANAWATTTTWGAARTLDTGDNIVWGTLTLDSFNIVWGTSLLDNLVWGTSGTADNLTWGTLFNHYNIVWGTDCGGADCDNLVWGTAADTDVTWGSSGDATDAVIYPDSSTTEPLPDVQLEFGATTLPGGGL